MLQGLNSVLQISSKYFYSQTGKITRHDLVWTRDLEVSHLLCLEGIKIVREWGPASVVCCGLIPDPSHVTSRRPLKRDSHVKSRRGLCATSPSARLARSPPLAGARLPPLLCMATQVQAFPLGLLAGRSISFLVSLLQQRIAIRTWPAINVSSDGVVRV